MRTPLKVRNLQKVSSHKLKVRRQSERIHQEINSLQAPNRAHRKASLTNQASPLKSSQKRPSVEEKEAKASARL